MNTKQKETQEDIELLLPWHAAGTLSRRDAARVDQALANDNELAARYELVREELGDTIDIHLGGADVRVDYAAALEWFFHAAEHGSAQAMFNIGTRYALGQGVARDEIEAFKWFELAAKEGIGGLRDSAAIARINLAARLTPVQVQMASLRAQSWIRMHRADRVQ